MRFAYFALAILSPVVAGCGDPLLAASRLQHDAYQVQAGNKIEGIHFEVVSVKQHLNKDDGWKYQYRASGFFATGIKLHDLVAEAYGIYDEKRIVGLPKWAGEDGFDIEAKVNDADVAGWQAMSLTQKRLLVCEILQQRFGLQEHFESRVFSVLGLHVKNGGPKLRVSPSSPAHAPDEPGTGGLVKRSQAGLLELENFDMKGFAELLKWSVGRPVVDETGLMGRYDLELRWEARNPTDNEVATGPSIYTALEEQLGLQVRPEKAPLDVLIVDRLERPSSN